MDGTNSKKDRPPPPVFSGDPDPEMEERLARDPCNLDAKVDVGSDESMDASDPPSVVRPGNNDPIPSSSAPDECPDESPDESDHKGRSDD